MLSTVRAAKVLCRLNGCMQNKTELGFIPCIFSQKTLYTGFWACRKIQKEPNLKDYVHYETEPKDLGRIVNFDLSKVEAIGEDDVKTENRKKKNIKKLNKVEPKENNGEMSENQNEHIGESETEEVFTDDYTKSKKKKLNLFKINSNSFCSTMTLLKSKKNREKEKKIILEGQRLINEAIAAGCKVEVLFYSRYSMVEKLKVPDTTKLCWISYKQLKLWSDVINTQGVIAVCEMPDLSVVKENPESIPLTVICDNIRDPGNLGSIFRVVAAVGCKKLILTKGCVNIWEPKVLRSACGAHFRLPTSQSLSWEEIDKEITDNSKILLADTKSPSIDDSLNEKDNGGNEANSLFTSNSLIRKHLPLLSYTSLEYSKQDSVIVIGGETEGISDEAYQFAEKRQGVRVHIPMSNDIISLNTGVALGVISYEIKRQIEDNKIKYESDELKEASIECQ